MTTPTHNPVGWTEIPVTNMERAMKFYETVFDYTLERNTLGGVDMAWFPFFGEGSGSGCSLVKYDKWYCPSKDGALLYFTAFSGDLAVELARVEAAGGTILEGKKEIAPEYGYMAIILDTEGNRIALHSKK